VPLTITLSQLGLELEKKREKLGWSLRRVEAATGISAATLSRIERSHIPDHEIVEKLAQWLGVNVQAAGDNEAQIKTDDELVQAIEVHLRASKRLPNEVARAIAQNVGVVLNYEVQKFRVNSEDG
jgi:transcriptional regulator with XRE-family HTH domain